MRPSSGVIIGTAAGFLLMAVMMTGDAALRKPRWEKAMSEGKALVRRLALTDLAVLPESPATRHLSLADRHTAFSEHPTALGLFPSGGLTPVPPP